MTTLLEARASMFARTGIAPDGGYQDRWVRLEVGPIPVCIPNTAGRIDAVRFHDLHHVLTGYATDWAGEFEISAWEVASGCADKSFAWLINLSAMAAGTMVSPRRTFRAFVRGLRTRNLYREPFTDALLGASLEDTRGRLGLSRDGRDATASEVGRFVGWTALAWVLVAAWVVPAVGLASLAWWRL